MTLPLIFFGLFMGTVGPQNVQIYDVPKPGDPALKGRSRLCPNASAEGGVSRSNETRASIEQLFGTLTAVEIHQFGSKFSDFSAVEKYVRGLLSQRREKYRAISRGRT